MPDLETVLRASLTERANQVEPREAAIRDAVSAIHRRRRMRSARVTLGTVAAVGAIVFAATSWHTTRPAAAPAAQASATTTPAATPLDRSSDPVAHTGITGAAHSGSPSGDTILTTTFGPDYTVQPQSPSGFGGDLTLTPGSPSARGLPQGYEGAVSLVVLSGKSDSAQGPVDTMTSLCGAMVEKGATMKACVPQTVNGLTVQRAEVDAPNSKIGTWANLRILYARPDKQVQYAEITIWNTAHTTTAGERVAADAWISAQNAKLANAATTPTS